MTYEEKLAKGQKELAAQMALAREQVNLTRKCNGKKDCPAPHHLSICLSR
jgi:hypothetical protein